MREQVHITSSTLLEGVVKPQTLSIRLLGGFSVVSDDEAVEGINTARLQSLFAYLVLHRDTSQLRQHLAFLFWPDSTEAQARNNLRQLLHALRGAVPSLAAFLSADNNTVRWRPDALFHLDVDDFEHALAIAEAAEQQNDQSVTLAALEQAVNLYQADLLPSCYDAWIVPDRERLRQRHLYALDRLLQLLEAQQKYAQAIGYAQRVIEQDPLNEDSYRRLMRLLTRTGDRAGAVRVYQTCEATLRRELGIEPSQVTSEAYGILLTNSAPISERPTIHPGMPLVIGRQREWGQLQDAWYQACTAGPSCVLVTGEAGIGKSRLAEELSLWAGQQGAATAKTRCYAAEGRLSLAPVTDWLRSESIRPHLARLDAVWLAEVARILPELTSEYPDLPPREPMSEYGQRQRFFHALALAMFAPPQPLLLLIDDLQWCDQETLEWLHYLARFNPIGRLLIIGTVRTEELPPEHPLHSLLLDLRSSIGVTEIALYPLDAAETAEMAARLAGHDLELDAVMRLYRETEGNPLFVVEALRSGFDQRAHNRDSQTHDDYYSNDDAHTLPPKVQAVIAGRLAQLSAPSRDIATVAATIGQEFGLDMLAHASGQHEEEVARALDELWRRRIIREHSANYYDFTHDKLREVAYAELGAPQRRLLHRRIAHALEAIHADDLDTVSGQIAVHYERAGMPERAIPFYQRAAAVSQRMYANDSAISLLSRSLALLEQTPRGIKRDRQELDLLLALGPLYRITKGWTAPELEGLVDRALALCDIVGDDTQRASALYGQQSLLVVQGKLEKVQLVADELEALYQRAQGAAPPLSKMMLAGARMHLGTLTDANEAFERIASTHPSTASNSLQESQGWNFAVHTRAWQAHALWCLGYPEQAISCGHDAIQLASDLGQPFNHALALTYFAMLQQLCADDATAKAHAEAALALATEYRAPYYRQWAEILTSYTLAQAQPDTAHLSSLRARITDFKASGARLRLPYYLGLLAQIYSQIGAIDEGLSVNDEALAESRANHERWWDAELHRQRAELMLALGIDSSNVEGVLLWAVEIARGQQAKSLELRATVSLARLWNARSRAKEARRQLLEVYSWFTEGFDTPDLQAARLLLTHLS